VSVSQGGPAIDEWLRAAHQRLLATCSSCDRGCPEWPQPRRRQCNFIARESSRAASSIAAVLHIENAQRVSAVREPRDSASRRAPVPESRLRHRPLTERQSQIVMKLKVIGVAFKPEARIADGFIHLVHLQVGGGEIFMGRGIVGVLRQRAAQEWNRVFRVSVSIRANPRLAIASAFFG